LVLTLLGFIFPLNEILEQEPRPMPLSFSVQPKLIAMINQTPRGDAPISSSPLTFNRN
jgi:hypothetical protein